MGAKRETAPADRWKGALAVVGAGALLLYGSKVLNNFYGPQPDYAMRTDLGAALDSEEFIQFLSLVTDGTRRRSRLRRLKNGSAFYPEQLQTIRRAQARDQPGDL